MTKTKYLVYVGAPNIPWDTGFVEWFTKKPQDATRILQVVVNSSALGRDLIFRRTKKNPYIVYKTDGFIVGMFVNEIGVVQTVYIPSLGKLINFSYI